MDTSFGIQQKGKRNLITDVAGITVGHCTLADGDVQTGVTALLPHQGDLFHDRCPAAVHVINGFGKSAGLVQVQELGYLETPLILTNTLSVGTAFTACVRYMLARNDQIGRAESTVNPVILECNDGYLNDIRGLHVTEDHVFAALDAADTTFALGAVGAGRGMSCYHLKGGIGSASRVFEIGEQTYAPLSSRQLSRVARRAQSGLARTGAVTEHGSGEIVLAFSTANRIQAGQIFHSGVYLNDEAFRPIFRAATETVEESIIRSMLEAETVTGRDGHIRLSLHDAMERAGLPR